MYAALIFFTRLPFWRLHNPRPEAFQRVVVYFTWVGWLTSAISIGVYLLASSLLPHFIAVLFALIARCLSTGCMHEDGLADTCDGFGGGNSRERTLEIMKDSHIGTYGVIGLILYFLLFTSTLSLLPASLLPWVIFAGDCLGRLSSSILTESLPYARTAKTSKAGITYSPMKHWERFISTTGGLLPMLPLLLIVSPWLILAILAPLAITMLGVLFFRHKIGGYTGDCCGALQLISELSLGLTILSTVTLTQAYPSIILG